MIEKPKEDVMDYVWTIPDGFDTSKPVRGVDLTPEYDWEVDEIEAADEPA